MPRQGNGGRDELRHGSASTTEPTQATLGEVTPTPSRAAVPATPTPDRRGLGREPRARPRGGPLADRVPVTPSARTFGPLRARSLHVWPVSSSPGGGVARPTGVGGVPRPGGYCVGAPAMLAVAATAAAATVPRPCGVITWGGAAREAVRGRRPRPSAAPSSSVAGCGPRHRSALPRAPPTSQRARRRLLHSRFSVLARTETALLPALPTRICPQCPLQHVTLTGWAARSAPSTSSAWAAGASSLQHEAGPCSLTCWDGPPTPRTGPASPAGAWGMGTPAGTPRPAALPTPGPPAAPASGTRAMPV